MDSLLLHYHAFFAVCCLTLTFSFLDGHSRNEKRLPLQSLGNNQGESIMSEIVTLFINNIMCLVVPGKKSLKGCCKTIQFIHGKPVQATTSADEPFARGFLSLRNPPTAHDESLISESTDNDVLTANFIS